MRSNRKWFFFNRLIACFMALCMMMVAGSVISRSATISDLESEKNAIEAEKKKEEEAKKKEQQALNEAKGKEEALESEMSEVQEKIEQTDQALIETIASVQMIESDISDKEAEIRETEKKYDEAKKVEDEQYASMKLRIKYMYEKGDYTYMQLLIESQNFSDMMNKVEYVEKLYEYDRKLLVKYQEAREETARIKEVLEDEKEELETTKLELKEEEEYLNGILEEQQLQYDDFKVKLEDVKYEVSVFKAQVSNRNKVIKNLEEKAKSKDKEIANAKAEEERKRKEAEAAQKAAQSSTSGSSGTNYKKSSEKSESSAGKSYASPGSFSGSTGERIIQYACQFVGNPYVYGGTSLTNGCDCSGFVQTVYRDFGYSIPRTGMRYIGTEVSFENAQPGDIVCYAGHVALYIGNGQIVHASTVRTGIKYGSVTYKPILSIRRIV